MNYILHFSMNFKKVNPWSSRVPNTLGLRGFTFSKFIIEKWGKYLDNSTWSRISTYDMILWSHRHLVLQACSVRFPCKCGPRPLRVGRLRGSAPPTSTPLGFQPWAVPAGFSAVSRISPNTLLLSLKEKSWEAPSALRSPCFLLVHLCSKVRPRRNTQFNQNKATLIENPRKMEWNITPIFRWVSKK